MAVFVAFLSTPNFNFHAFGRTKTEAVDLMLKAWETHAEQAGADPTLVGIDDINVLEGFTGAVFRDASPFRVLPPGHGNHAPETHIHRWVCDNPRDEIGRVLCNECAAPIFQCTVTGNFHHVNPVGGRCFLEPYPLKVQA